MPLTKSSSFKAVVLNHSKLRSRRGDQVGDKSDESMSEMMAARKSNAMFNDEIANLRIRREDLEHIKTEQAVVSGVQHSSMGGSAAGSPPLTGAKRHAVRRELPLAEQKLPLKEIKILRKAPSDAPAVPFNNMMLSGPRYDQYGNLVPHSILGSPENYYDTAVKKGHIKASDVPVIYQTKESSRPISVKYFRRPHAVSSARSLRSSVYEYGTTQGKALANWQSQMADRRKFQADLSRTLNRPAAHLLMNTGEGFRKIQENRYLIDRTIPFVDRGKGFRVGSEFWQETDLIGTEDTGIYSTLTQTQKGYPPPIQHCGDSEVAEREKGLSWKKTATPRYPWSSEYFNKRIAELQPIMQELDSHAPEFGRLHIKGESSTKSLTAGDAVVSQQNTRVRKNGESLIDQTTVQTTSEQTIGPSIMFGDQCAKWTGSSSRGEGSIGTTGHLLFDSENSQRDESVFTIVNNGTSVIYYSWNYLPKTNPFNLVVPPVRRFYFDSSSGVLQPGTRTDFPFVFKSDNPGLFTEQWAFSTTPVLCGGASLVLNLRGICRQDDVRAKARMDLEASIRERAVHNICRSILEELLANIKVPDRPRSPVDAYITIEEQFSRVNNNLHYNLEHAEQLEACYDELCPLEDEERREWDLSTYNLRRMVENRDDIEDTRKEELGEKLLSTVESIGIKPPEPSETLHGALYKCTYRALMGFAEDVAGYCAETRSLLDLPELEFEYPENVDPRKKLVGKEGKNRASVPPKGDAKQAAGQKVVKEQVPPKTDPKGKAQPGKGKKSAIGKDDVARDGKEGSDNQSCTPDPEPEIPMSSEMKKYQYDSYVFAYSAFSQLISDLLLDYETLEYSNVKCD